MFNLKNDQILQMAFLVSGIYDLFLGVGVLFFSDMLISIFGISKPDNMTFVLLTGLFLLFAGYCQIYAGYHDVKKMVFVGLGMVVLRFSYLILAVLGFFSGELEYAYLAIGLTDGIMAVVLLIPIHLTEGTSISQFWRYDKKIES
jgi:Na+-driven multidrug efflux pump